MGSVLQGFAPEYAALKFVPAVLALLGCLPLLRQPEPWRLFLPAIVLSLVVTPYVWSYDFVLLAPVIAEILRRAWERGAPK